MPLVSRRGFLLAAAAGAALPIRAALAPAGLQIRFDGDFLRVSVPRLQLLAGKPMDRLRDGASVIFFAQLSLSTGPSADPAYRSVAQFAFSYDIWEEKFSVTRLQQTRRSASNLTADGAEAWLFENLTLSAGDIPRDRPFWVHLEIRGEDPHETLDWIGGSGISLTRLIEVFSRPARTAQPHWKFDGGPFVAADLRNGSAS